MKFLQPKYNDFLIKRNQTVSDITGGVLKAIKDSKEQAQIIAPYLVGRTRQQTLKNIFNFCKKNVKYVREPNSLQTAKTLPRILADKHGDCKHYAICVASLCKALNIPVKLRLISQNYFSPEPTHIYAVSGIGAVEVVIDPVLKNFANEAIYRYKYDINI